MSQDVANFLKELPQIIKEANYDELWGQQLSAEGDFYEEKIVKALLEKFLVANSNVLQSAKDQLTRTLKWRKEFKPLSAAFHEKHDPKYDTIGILTYYPEAQDRQHVITWNLYGKVGDTKTFFQDFEGFIRWRVGLMEQGVHLLQFDDKAKDQMVQIHDYQGVSFLRPDSQVKKSSKEIINLFSNYYPEVLSKKLFVNVPSVLTWVFHLIKGFVSLETRKKFFVMSSCSGVEETLKNPQLPSSYGGKGEDLKSQRFVFSDVGTQAKVSPYAAHILSASFTEEMD